jgi:hypothetical protein
MHWNGWGGRGPGRTARHLPEADAAGWARLLLHDQHLRRSGRLSRDNLGAAPPPQAHQRQRRASIRSLWQLQHWPLGLGFVAPMSFSNRVARILPRDGADLRLAGCRLVEDESRDADKVGGPRRQTAGFGAEPAGEGEVVRRRVVRDEAAACGDGYEVGGVGGQTEPYGADV